MRFSKDDEVNDALKSIIVNLTKYLENRIELDNALLFGSCARGTATAKSDVDVAVLSHVPLHLRIMPGIDLIVFPADVLERPKFPVHEIIKKEGIPLSRVLKEIEDG